MEFVCERWMLESAAVIHAGSMTVTQGKRRKSRHEVGGIDLSPTFQLTVFSSNTLVHTTPKA